MGDELDFHSWELLSAYLDGALDDIASAMVERAVRYDPELSNALEDLRRQKAALKQWAAEIEARPVPPRIRVMLDRARRERDGRDDTAGQPGENPPKE
ncbi:MAG: hypothetical protein RLO51_22055 [Thalassobaculum sp.]|uniref:anti-sigma factor family protein n=1 Tax=Thalassobaculum sp. TaxID=2022740 RepID=UPI0032EAF6C1